MNCSERRGWSRGSHLLPSVLLVLLGVVVPAEGAVVYTQDFEAAGTPLEWTGGGGIDVTGGLSVFGFGQQHWRNPVSAATTLTLTGLGPHTFIDVTFDLAMWDSIDWGSDTIQVAVDGNFGINQTFGNYFAPGACPNGCMDGPGTALTPGPVDFVTPEYGYNSGFRDSARHVNFQLAHTASTAVITFQFPNTQGGLDESFGVDNVVIAADVPTAGGAVPEPASVSLIVLGAAAGLYIRRKY